MGFRSQFEGLVELADKWADQVDVYMVYGKEAFPEESKWPAPVPDGLPVRSPGTLEERRLLADRFVQSFSSTIPVLLDDLEDTAMNAYDAYPFRVFALDTDGKIAVPSAKGAAGFDATLEAIDDWLGTTSG